MREANKSLQFERDDLKQKLSDAQGDIKVMYPYKHWVSRSQSQDQVYKYLNDVLLNDILIHRMQYLEHVSENTV